MARLTLATDKPVIIDASQTISRSSFQMVLDIHDTRRSHSVAVDTFIQSTLSFATAVTSTNTM
jgi:hypothetical protein